MPRYLVERTLGDVTPADLEQISAKSTEIRLARYPQVEWEHSHVVRSDAGSVAICLYESPDRESVQGLVDEMGVPADRFFEIETDLVP